MNQEKDRRRGVNLWIYLGLTGLYLAANYVYDSHQESVKQRQADEFWAAVSPAMLSVFSACQPGAINIAVPEGWAVKSLARESGLAGSAELFGFEFPARVPDDVLDPYNPGLPGRQDRALYARMDSVVLPRTDGALDLASRLGQYPFPGAPAEGVVEWLSAADPEGMAKIRRRAADMMAHLLGDWRQAPQDPEVLRDMCVWRLHGAVENGPFWPSSQDELENTLAFYRARYELNDFVQSIRWHMDIQAPFLNNLLAAAGIDQKLPPDVGRYPIFGTIQNSIGGGWSDPRPYFTVFGNYPEVEIDALGRPYTLNPLLADSGTVSFAQALRGPLHEAGHVYIQPGDSWENYLTQPQWTFAHSGMGLWTMAVEMNDSEFSPADALDPRVQYVFHTLIYSQTTGYQSAYLQMLRGVMRFENVDKIAAAYDQFRQDGDPPFDELFAADSPWIFENSPYGKYLAGRGDPQSEYQKDIDRLQGIILQLMTKTQSKNSDRRQYAFAPTLRPDFSLPPQLVVHQSTNHTGRQVVHHR